MNKKSIKHGARGFKVKASESQLHLSAQRLPGTKKENLYRELQSSGSIDAPEAYKQTHL